MCAQINTNTSIPIIITSYCVRMVSEVLEVLFWSAVSKAKLGANSLTS